MGLYGSLYDVIHIALVANLLPRGVTNYLLYVPISSGPNYASHTTCKHLPATCNQPSFGPNYVSHTHANTKQWTSWKMCNDEANIVHVHQLHT